MAEEIKWKYYPYDYQSQVYHDPRQKDQRVEWRDGPDATRGK